MMQFVSHPQKNKTQKPGSSTSSSENGIALENQRLSKGGGMAKSQSRASCWVCTGVWAGNLPQPFPSQPAGPPGVLKKSLGCHTPVQSGGNTNNFFAFFLLCGVFCFFSFCLFVFFFWGFFDFSCAKSPFVVVVASSLVQLIRFLSP